MNAASAPDKASCGVVQTAVSAVGAGVASQANVLQGVVTGIGFIGAGAIIRQGDFTTGHATAASIWTVGIIGAAVGYGYFDIGIILAVANLAVLALRAPLPAQPSPRITDPKIRAGGPVAEWGAWRRSSDGHLGAEHDVVAQGIKVSDQALGGAILIDTVEVVGSE